MTSKSSAASLTGKPLKDLTVVELKTLCKERGIKGFVHKSKAKLLEMIEAASETSGEPTPETTISEDNQDSAQQVDIASLTIAQLKQLCKDQGIKGFARKNKQQLLQLINSATPQEASDADTDSDQLYSEDLDANQVDEDQFDVGAEETMIEVSDSLIIEVLDRFDRIEALLQRIAKNVDKP